MTVNKERVELWAQALESDGYKQCTGNLRLSLGTRGQLMHCAEGVAMAVAEAHGVKIYPFEWDASGMGLQVLQWYGLSHSAFVEDDHGELMTVIHANDDAGLSFWDIAQRLRAAYLKEEES